MTKITKEEALRIARMSQLEILPEEVDELVANLEQVLSYAVRVQEIATEVQEPSIKNVNVFREDMVRVTDSAPYLAQAPEREEDFFVVPRVIKN